MDELYRQELMDIFKDPSHKGSMKKPTVSASQNNPLCGDALTMHLEITDGVIKDIKFEANACAVSVISSELLADALIGERVEAAKGFTKEDFLKKLDLNLTTSRIKCATLALSALQEAINTYEKTNKRTN